MNLPTLIKAMDFATYLADPAPDPSMTSSIVRDILETAPRIVWQNTKRLNKDAEDTNKTIFDLGSAAHALFTGEGNPIAVIDADAFRSNAAKEARDAAYAAGKTPILKGNMERVQAMADAARAGFAPNSDIGKLIDDPATLKEATIIWTEGGVMHRCRPDFYHPGENVVIHYKTTGTSIAPHAQAKYAAGAGWYLTAAHYGAGIKTLTGDAPRQFFAMQETAAPHLCAVAELDRTFLETGKMRRERAITIWARCLRENVWPGYPSRTATLECPEWLERNLTAQKDAENEARSAGRDLLDLAARWQAPEGWQPAAEMKVATT